MSRIFNVVVTACIIAVSLLTNSCSTQDATPELIHTSVASEDSVTIHYPPVAMTILNDSIVSMGISSIDYWLFNYRTGATVKKIEIPQDWIRLSVKAAKLPDTIAYLDVDPTEAKKLGISPYQVRNICHSCKGDTSIIFANIMAVVHDSIIYNGVKDQLVAYKRLQFAFYTDLSLSKIYFSRFITNKDTTFCDELTGVAYLNDLIFCRNMPEKDHHLVTILEENGPLLNVKRRIILADTLPMAKSLTNNHTMSVISFFKNEDNELFICDGYAFYDKSGMSLYNYNDSMSSENIYAFTKTSKSFLFHTKRVTENRITNKVYSYTDNRLRLLMNFEGMSTGAFTKKSEFLALVKDEEQYKFKLYKLLQ